MNGRSTQKVLVAPLDWGLGHATRCIPIIKSFVDKGFDVVIAAEGAGEALLRLEFPHVRFLELKGYRVEYGKTKWELLGKMLWQIPQILESIDEEKDWLAAVMEQEKFDIIISDNRYGLHHPDAHCVFIGHQLLVKTSLGDIVDHFLQPFQLDLINKFDECWVPDLPGEINLAGDLSHPENLPRIPLTYIGPLSRMQARPATETENMLIVLSGPEPQRSILEEALLVQLPVLKSKVVMVRGLPGETFLPEVPSHVTVLNHLAADDLSREMCNASLLVGRCGYSTVMDIVKLQKKNVLIPTPGQTEQEYLSAHLMQQGIALCFEQDGFNLVAAVEMSKAFNYYFPELDEKLLDHAVDQVLIASTAE